MSPLLRLELPRLDALHADSEVPFALLDRKHRLVRDGILPLREIAAALPPNSVAAILHPIDAVLAQVSLPPLPANRQAAAVAGAVEPLLLGDVQDCAIAAGRRQPDGLAPVAWTARAPLQAAWALLHELGLKVQAWVPAPLTLPWEPDTLTLMPRDGALVARWSLDQGAVLDAEVLDALSFTTPAPAGTAPTVAQAEAAQALTDGILDWLARLRPDQPLPPITWVGGAMPAPAGLPIALRLDPGQRWLAPLPAWSLALPALRPAGAGQSPWLPALGWCAGAALLWLAGFNLYAWQQHRDMLALEQSMQAQVVAALPDIPVVLAPLRQATQYRDRLQGNAGDTSPDDFLPLALASAQWLAALQLPAPAAIRYQAGDGLFLTLTDTGNLSPLAPEATRAAVDARLQVSQDGQVWRFQSLDDTSSGNSGDAGSRVQITSGGRPRGAQP